MAKASPGSYDKSIWRPIKDHTIALAALYQPYGALLVNRRPHSYLNYKSHCHRCSDLINLIASSLNGSPWFLTGYAPGLAQAPREAHSSTNSITRLTYPRVGSNNQRTIRSQGEASRKMDMDISRRIKAATGSQAPRSQLSELVLSMSSASLGKEVWNAVNGEHPCLKTAEEDEVELKEKGLPMWDAAKSQRILMSEMRWMRKRFESSVFWFLINYAPPAGCILCYPPAITYFDIVFSIMKQTFVLLSFSHPCDFWPHPL